MSGHYIGLISGTSADGIDAAVFNFDGQCTTTIAHHSHQYPADIRKTILNFSQPSNNELNIAGQLDVALGHLFADAAIELLNKAQLKPNDIAAIGSHGQTIRHSPKHFSLQVGDPNIIVQRTNITTVADFRRRDMAAGGEGAPLAPAFHAAMFRDQTNHATRGILNIGGIANLTVLPPAGKVIGFDTGPGNTLMDAWVLKHREKPFDLNGQWADTGSVDEPLLAAMLSDPYFTAATPKSTGPEYFNLKWLNRYIKQEIPNENIQATLMALTIHTIAPHLEAIPEVYVCGGGAQNNVLLAKLADLTQRAVCTTESLGVHPDWVEAAAFAWIAQQTLERKPGSLSSVTGATADSILGAVYYP